MGLSADTDFKQEIKNLFSFSSEFTHIGYVSTFFTSSNTSEVIFGDSISPYLPSTENFSELKYRDISTQTGLNIGNVGYRLHHILKELADKLRKLGFDEKS